MKKLFAFILPLLLISLSCTKTEETIIIQEVEPANSNTNSPCIGTSISYPDSAFYGINILGLSDSSTIGVTPTYSFSAVLGCSANLEIRIFTTGGAPWSTGMGTSQGWLVGLFDFVNTTQIFQSINDGSLDLFMSVGGSSNSPGGCRIDFYENNSSTPTNSKYVFWQ